MKDDLIKLAERVEAAAGPDRELDCAVAESAGWTDVWHRNGMAEGWAPTGKCEAGIPRYTASIDAALTLVPEGMRWSVDGEGLANVWTREIGYPVYCSTAATPALALCAAALRAQAAKGEAP